MRVFFGALLLGSLAAGCGTTPEEEAEEAARPKLVESLSAFNHPDSCAFNADGRRLYVTNSAAGEFGSDRHPGFVVGKSSVARVSVSAEGGLTLRENPLIDELTGALGIAVSPRSVGGYPKGSLFVCCGNALQCTPDGRYLAEAAKLGTAVRVFDALTGRALGKIDLGAGSAVAQEIGHEVLLPNALAFDPEGVLYLSDTGEGGEHLSPRVLPHPGILRIELGSEGGLRQVSFTPVAGVPSGLAYSDREGCLYWVTFGARKSQDGALFRDSVQVGEKLGACGGVAFTPGGSILVSRLEGDLVLIRPGGSREKIFVDPLTKARFSFPSDVKTWPYKDGACLVIVPEQEGWNPAPGTQRLRAIKLPSGY